MDRKKLLNATIFVVVVATLAVSVNTYLHSNSYKYGQAMKFMQNSDFNEASAIFIELGDYKDSKTQALENEYRRGELYYVAMFFRDAIATYTELGNYKDSAEKRLDAMDAWKSADVYQSTVSAGKYNTIALDYGSINIAGDFVGEEFSLLSQYYLSAISSGSRNVIGLHSDGAVEVFGNNDYGQCDVTSWTDVVAVSAGDDFVVGLQSDGNLVAAGRNNHAQCDVENWNRITAISAGKDFVVGLKRDGTVVAIGNNDAGQCEVSG
jgi:alpha-tubulin suppressor-like RCC1 family protein